MTSQTHRATGLAHRYANALFALAHDENALDRVHEDCTTILRLLDESPDLARLVRSPALSREDQAKAMKAVLARMGASTLVANFAGLLAAKGRLFILGDAIGAFEHLLASARGEIEAEVTSARALSEAERAELAAVLKSRLGREPRLQTRVDPGLLGGLVVKVGSRMIDSSIATKLSGIRAAMRGS